MSGMVQHNNSSDNMVEKMDIINNNEKETHSIIKELKSTHSDI